jgi:hypothetical protein
MAQDCQRGAVKVIFEEMQRPKSAFGKVATEFKRRIVRPARKA